MDTMAYRYKGKVHYPYISKGRLPGSAKEEKPVAMNSTGWSPALGGLLPQWLQLLPVVCVRVEPVEVIEVYPI